MGSFIRIGPGIEEGEPSLCVGAPRTVIPGGILKCRDPACTHPKTCLCGVGVSTRVQLYAGRWRPPRRFEPAHKIIFDTREENTLHVDYLLSTGNFLLLEIISRKFTIILPGTVSRGDLFLDE